MTDEIINENDIIDSQKKDINFEEAIEAILFAAGHPVSYATLARVFETTPSKVKSMVFDYSLKYNQPSELPRGVILLTYSDSCQLCTKETYLSEIRDALGIKKSGTLSTSAMETLAVVAYNQPVTRVFVDTIRKVDSSYAMNSLIDRGLIECVGRLDVPGRPMLYGTTEDFLRCFGFGSIMDLPAASEELISMFEKTKNKEEETANGEQLRLSFEETSSENNSAPDESAENSLNETDDPSAEDDVIIDD